MDAPRYDDPYGQIQAGLNAAAWAGAVEFAILSPTAEAQAIRERYRAETGIDVSPPLRPCSPLERMIDEACQRETWPAFVEWFNREIWGEEWAPEAGVG